RTMQQLERDFDAVPELAALVADLHDEIQRRLDEQTGTENVVVLDVPLLVESGWEGMIGTIVVDLHPDVAVERLVQHRGFDETDARNRIAKQATREERLAKADFVIDNHGHPHELDTEVDRAWEWIHSLEV
ncbi:MAG: dephospho-CoA kinase, partial [Microthrixaceae bacterium]